MNVRAWHQRSNNELPANVAYKRLPNGWIRNPVLPDEKRIKNSVKNLFCKVAMKLVNVNSNLCTLTSHKFEIYFYYSRITCTLTLYLLSHNAWIGVIDRNSSQFWSFYNSNFNTAVTIFGSEKHLNVAANTWKCHTQKQWIKGQFVVTSIGNAFDCPKRTCAKIHWKRLTHGGAHLSADLTSFPFDMAIQKPKQ